MIVVYDDNRERALFFTFCIVTNEVQMSSLIVSCKLSSCNSRIMLSATDNNSSKSLYMSLSIREWATSMIALTLSVLDLRPTKVGNVLCTLNQIVRNKSHIH